MELEVDEKGVLTKSTIVAEDPPYLGFGPQVAEDLQGARFIPAFRNGHAVASKTALTVFFTANEMFRLPPFEPPSR